MGDFNPFADKRPEAERPVRSGWSSTGSDDPVGRVDRQKRMLSRGVTRHTRLQLCSHIDSTLVMVTTSDSEEVNLLALSSHGLCITCYGASVTIIAPEMHRLCKNRTLV